MGKEVIKKIKQLQEENNRPILVCIDGGSGAGKSTFALSIAQELDATIVPIDDFFSNIPENDWFHFSISEKLDNIWDWKRLRNTVIKPLLRSEKATWKTIDFELGLQNDGRYKWKTDHIIMQPAKVIFLEGAYSCSPKLTDLIDMTILIDVEIKKRHARLSKREKEDFLEKWHQLWDDVEEYYYSKIRPKDSYDWIVKN